MLKQCAVCGNEYDKSIQITYNGQTNFFDSFECAIHALAPECEACGNKIIGHGVEVDDIMYCCSHCARKEGEMGLSDRQHSSIRSVNSEL